MYKLNIISKIKKNTLLNDKAFSLIEMMVVASLIAVLSTLMVAGLISAGRQVRLRDVAKTMQTEIRAAGNNSISVAPDFATPDVPSKAWDVRLDTSSPGGFSLLDYRSGNNADSSIQNFSFANTGNVIGSIKVGGTPITTLHLVFSSPFAEFRAIQGNIDGWVLDPSNPESEAIVPTGSVITQDIVVQITNGSETINITINPETGESSID